MTHQELSPWQAVLGEHFADLHPQLVTYFSRIPSGSVGVGVGEFDTVGTPRRWLRGLIRVVADTDVLFPVWEHNVPFTVTNIAALSTVGSPAVAAKRVFRLSHGDLTMRDVIVATPDGLVDVLGVRRRFRALFASRVVDGALHLTSTSVALRVGTHHWLIPRLIAPRVSLTERFSDADGLQHVSLTMEVPFVGKVYEYAGSFRYEITSEAV